MCYRQFSRPSGRRATVLGCMVQHISGLSCISCNSCEMERERVRRRTTSRAVGLHWAPDGSTEAHALDAHDVPTHRFFPLLEARWIACDIVVCSTPVFVELAVTA